MMDLSVVIVSYNVRHFLEQCLRSVMKASVGISCEILVVDNNSADGSCSMVSTAFPSVKLIRNSGNPGFSAACNQAITAATGDFILLLNPDTVVEEDTFRKCITFMTDHPDAGALGVRMLNGSGRLLPESKRAFPTPSTAFFRISGLSALFPRSGYFNRYYMGDTDSSSTAEVEVLSGAFMFIRKKVLEQTGLLDESYFMYGEDIDLSYKIVKAGYKNYYYPGVKIIHYKGESAGKTGINSTLHFYKAMLVFIKSHFDNRKYRPFLAVIRLAVYFTAILALLGKIASRYFLPILDAICIFLVFSVVTRFWGSYRFGNGYNYPVLFTVILIPFFIIVSLVSVYFSGGYRVPSHPFRVFRGLLVSSAAVLVIYALLPSGLRFSRAVILFGSMAVTVLIPAGRIIGGMLGSGSVVNPLAKAIRTAIVCSDEDFRKLCNLTGSAGRRMEIAGRVGITGEDLGKDVLGDLSQIREIIRVNRIARIIYSGKDLTASQLIASMQDISDMHIDIRISPDGDNLLIGSRNVHRLEEL
ncbi:MAG TPA: glycosyltransferase family 2 protein [Bacteroidales bacterium]|nr:glycosyltransferase family 2 protein [Bacteroidales bacterium]